MDGQIVFGDSQGSLQDVVLECSPDLIGDSLSIHLTQAAGSAAVWIVRVEVHVAQGKYRLGNFTTISPAAGATPSRTIALATCPGAIGWSLQVSCVTAGEIAGFTLQSSRCCTKAIGVEPVTEQAIPGEGVTILGPFPLPVAVTSFLPNPLPVDATIVGPNPLPIIGNVNATIVGPNPLPTLEADRPWSRNFSTALANSFVIKATPGILRSATVRVDSTLATGTYYLQLWNLAAVPADTTAVTLLNSMSAPVKVIHVNGTNDIIEYDFNEYGEAFSVGSCFNLSNTEFTKTLTAGSFLSVENAEYR